MPALPAFAGDARTAGLALLGLLLLAGVGYAFWSQGQRQAALSAQLEREVADSTRFATTIALVTSMQARQDTIRQQIAVIRDVDQRRYVWPHLMEEISRAVPPFTWLTQLRSTEPNDTTVVGPLFAVQGNAGSTQALTRFMKNLESSLFIRDVTLVTSEQVEVEGRALHRFTLEARYETPPPTAVEMVPVIVVE